jgi:hypothetical protein
VHVVGRKGMTTLAAMNLNTVATVKVTTQLTPKTARNGNANEI